MVESGQKFGKYTLIEKLASGGMAEIFEVRVEGIGGFEKTVAIKRLHRRYSDDDQFVSMLVDEAKLVVRLSHPNIGQIFDLGEIDGQYFIVMEYVDGLNLAELVEAAAQQNRSLPMEAMVYTLVRVADALHYAHTKRGPQGRPLDLVHRDVSPQNIMLSAEGDVKLVDFGIAKARMGSHQTQAGVIKGKYRYMSPEQGHGNPVDARTDVYALGMILYEQLTGTHPYEDTPQSAMIRRVRRADFPPIHQIRPELPDALLSIVDRALRRNREYRFSTTREFKRALEDFAGDRLQRFDRSDLANLVRRFETGRNEGGERELLDTGEFSADERSLLFDAGGIEDQPPELLRRRQRAEDEFGSQRDPIGRTPEDQVTTSRVAPRFVTTLLNRLRGGVKARPRVLGAGLVAVAVAIFGVSLWLLGDWDGKKETSDEPIRPPTQQPELPRADEHGVLVTSVPSGARVSLDGESRGTTPVVLDTLQEGHSYRLRIDREGFASAELTLEPGRGQADRAVRLEPLAGVEGGPGDSEGDTEGDFADRSGSADNRESNRPPRSSPPEPAQPPTSNGPEDRPRDGRTEQQRRGLDIWQFGEDAETGRLNVRTDAQQGRIYVDGEMVKDGAALTGHPLEPGTHDVQVYFTVDGSYSEPRRVEIRAGETSTVRISR